MLHAWDDDLGLFAILPTKVLPGNHMLEVYHVQMDV